MGAGREFGGGNHCNAELQGGGVEVSNFYLEGGGGGRGKMVE